MTEEKRARLSPDYVPDTRKYESVSANDYAELGLVEYELGVCKNMIAFANNLDRIDLTNAEVAGVLWRDTVLVLAEMFGPKGLNPDEVFAGDQDAHEALSWMRKVRVSYSAHRFGAGRWSMSAVHLLRDGRATKVLGVSYFTRLVPFGGDEMKAHLDEFIEIIQAYIRPKLDALNQTVLDEAQQVPGADLWALPPAKHEDVDLTKVDLTRKQVRSGEKSTGAHRATRRRDR